MTTTITKLQERKQSTEQLLTKHLEHASVLEQQHKQVTEKIYEMKGRVLLLNELINEAKTQTKEDDK